MAINTQGSRGESKSSFKVDTFARIFGLTRQAIINDDLGAFTGSVRLWGRAGADMIADNLVALLTANSGDGDNLDDGNPLFSTTRGNKGTGAAITVAALSIALKAIRETKGLDGVTPISVTPKHLLVGAAKETEAEQVLASLSAVQVGETNPFAGKLSLHVEPRLTGNAWRVFADPSEVPVIEYAYLDGYEGPQMSIKEGWTVLGQEFRCVLDFGCGLADWRGSYLNPGN